MKTYLFWVDIKNSHEPAFFQPFLDRYGAQNFFITARDYAEIRKLLEQRGIEYISVGKHYGKSFISKVFGRFVIRNLTLFFKVPKFKYGLSHMSMENALVSKSRLKKVISFTDNDFEQYYSKIQLPFIDYLIIPQAIDSSMFRDMGMKGKILSFNGFKEDIYIADYTPDPKFLGNLPFKDFITVRPEALKAEYVSKNARSIVQELLKALDKNGYNILYLPRYTEDRAYAKGIKSIYIPPEPLNGLDIAYYSKAVLTGSGTLGREAACMGVPAVSFYPGEKLLSVDTEMINRGWLFHSRDLEDIVNYIMSSRRRKMDLSRSKKVKQEVISIIEEIIEGD